MKNLENTTLDGNTGHFHEEIDLAGSEDFEESEFWRHEFLYSFLRHLPGDRRTVFDDFPVLVMVICDVFYSYFSDVPMFKNFGPKTAGIPGQVFIDELMASMGLWTMDSPTL